MWKVGSTTRLTEFASMPNMEPATPAKKPMLALVNIAPLGSPVVPEVYSCSATSSGRPRCPGSGAGGPASQSA